jgi:hypothetical protein
MELTLIYPWFAFAAAALGVVGGAFAYWKRRVAPMLLLLGAAAFLLAAARPQVGAKPTDVRHALVVDVSGSMSTRPEVSTLVDSLQLPPGHSFVRYDLSDALRTAGSARGEDTDYARLADLAADDSINGEVVLITDGRGQLGALYSAIDARRLILLRAPPPLSPDAAVLGLTAPSSVPSGGAAMLRAVIRCDADARVPWRLLDGSAEVAAGAVAIRADVPAMLELAQPLVGERQARLTLLLDLPADRESRNDQASVAVNVGTKRRIEYCSLNTFPEHDALYQLLASDPGNDIHQTHEIPASGRELDGVALVVINNLTFGGPRAELAALADWVHAGGSLLMVGTDGAFGPGGYRGTAIEEVMPVRFRPDDAPPRRVVLLLDSSASMGEALAGGGTRLGRLKEGAANVLRGLGASDLASVVGFRERLLGQVTLLPAGDPGLATQIGSLSAQGATHIATSLEQVVGALAGLENTRVVMVTDGEDVEGAGQGRYEAIAAKFEAGKVRLDVVLTEDIEPAWTKWMEGGHRRVWPSGDFDDMLETLDQAVAHGDQEWILNKSMMRVDGVSAMLRRMVRTAERSDASVTTSLRAQDGEQTYPLLARRQLVGRTACLTTDSWGDPVATGFWSDATFAAAFNSTIEFLLANTGALKLALNPLADGAELVWTGEAGAPAGDLETSAGVARLDGPGRWRLDAWPTGDELKVFAGGNLLQRIALPQLVAAELQRTGDDEVFFAVAGEGGIRVFHGLDSWQPRNFVESVEEPRDITWVAALVGMLAVLAGFALRRR